MPLYPTYPTVQHMLACHAPCPPKNCLGIEQPNPSSQPCSQHCCIQTQPLQCSSHSLLSKQSCRRYAAKRDQNCKWGRGTKVSSVQINRRCCLAEASEVWRGAQRSFPEGQYHSCYLCKCHCTATVLQGGTQVLTFLCDFNRRISKREMSLNWSCFDYFFEISLTSATLDPQGTVTNCVSG